jgi:hypothetical protein
MKKLLSLLSITVLFSTNCIATEDSTDAIKVEIKIVKEYELKSPQRNYIYEIRRNGYQVLTDSVKQKRYDIEVAIKNTSDKSIYIWLMTCSWYSNFQFNNNYMSIEEPGCDHNKPSLVEIKPGGFKIYETTLSRSIKFDYPCKGCVYGPQVETTKMGLIIINDIFKQEEEGFLGYNILMQDKSNWKIIWSNPLYLLGKQPQSKTIFSIKEKLAGS